jgi:hypothetical protein
MRIRTRVDATGFRKYRRGCDSFDERAASIGALFLCQGHSVAAEKRAEFGAGLISWRAIRPAVLREKTLSLKETERAFP